MSFVTSERVELEEKFEVVVFSIDEKFSLNDEVRYPMEIQRGTYMSC